MRILLLMSQDSPWSLSIASSLHNVGHEIHVLDWSAEEGNSHALIPAVEAGAVLGTFAGFSTVPKSPFSPLSLLRMTQAIRHLSRSISPDIILCLYGGILGFASFLSGVRPYALYAVGSDVLLQTAVNRRLNRLIFGYASLVIANGRNVARNVLMQAPSAKVFNLLMGTDTNAFRPGPVPTVPRFYSHRTFYKTYNNEAIIRALARFPETAPDFEFIFSGGGPDLESARELAARILPETIKTRVKFLGGGLATEELARQLGASDFFVSMSFSDGTSTCLLEALSCGLYPILSDIPANSDLIDEFALAGALVPLHDYTGLTAALIECVRNASEYRDIAKQNRAKIVQQCDTGASRRKLAELLAEEVSR